MRNYVPEDDFAGSISFQMEGNQFENLEISIAIDRIMESKEDTTWKIGVGGSIFAAPLTHDGIVYFGACDKNFYAVDADNGKEIWKFSTEGAILSTACIYEGTIYFGSFDGNFYAVSPDGELVWKFSAGDKIYSDPCIWKGMVYFGSHNGNVYALDKKTGRMIWRFGTSDPVSSSPAIDDGVLYIGSNDGNLYAIDADSGELVWRFAAEGGVRYKPLIMEGKIIFGSLDGNMRAVDRQGRLVWKFPTSDGIATYPLLFGNLIFFGSRNKNWYAVDSDGRMVMRFRCKGYPNEVVVLDDVIYMGCCESGLYAIDRRTGKELWTFPTNGFVLRIREYRGNIYFGSWDCNLYSISPGGSLRWKFHTSMSYQSPLKPEEESPTKTFEIVWKPEAHAEKEAKYRDGVSGEYDTDLKSDYTSSLGKDYIGLERGGHAGRKKKQHYL
jgi:outer membrane protein assembly factor BamB